MTHNDRSLCRAWLYLNLNDSNVFRRLPSICVHIDIDASMQKIMTTSPVGTRRHARVRAEVGYARARTHMGLGSSTIGKTPYLAC